MIRLMAVSFSDGTYCSKGGFRRKKQDTTVFRGSTEKDMPRCMSQLVAGTGIVTIFGEYVPKVSAILLFLR